MAKIEIRPSFYMIRTRNLPRFPIYRPAKADANSFWFVIPGQFCQPLLDLTSDASRAIGPLDYEFPSVENLPVRITFHQLELRAPDFNAHVEVHFVSKLLVIT